MSEIKQAIAAFIFVLSLVVLIGSLTYTFFVKTETVEKVKPTIETIDQRLILVEKFIKEISGEDVEEEGN